MNDGKRCELAEQMKQGEAASPSVLRVTVVSPFVDKRHGTERALIETIERFASVYGCEIHLYAESVEDIVLSPKGTRGAGTIVWRRVPPFPGPHLFRFVAWYAANRVLRWFDARFRGLKGDLVFTPGINCSDADVIVAHIVFTEFYRIIRASLRLRDVSLRSWPVTIHRVLYYRLIMALEKRIYPRTHIGLAGVSELTTEELQRHFGRANLPAIPYGVDLSVFNPAERLRRRQACREEMGFTDEDFVVVLVGNDWKKKGLGTILQAMANSGDIPFRLLVAGHDDRAPYLVLLRRLGLADRVVFRGLSPDVMQFYAAADVYAGPSLHDAFAIPPLEAMACGLPVIASLAAGVSRCLDHGRDGFVLKDACDPGELGRLLETLYRNKELAANMGNAAVETARQYTWDRHAAEVWKLVQEAQARKVAGKAQR